ncbi:MAG: peptidoglycan DD-metalloendopeptidase family protein [Pseudohongiella sp.]
MNAHAARLTNTLRYRLPARLRLCHLFAPLLLALTAAVFPVAAQQENTEAQLAAINDSIGQIETWLQEARNQRSSEEAALSEINQRIDAINGDIADNQRNIDGLDAELSTLSRQQETLLADSEAQREIVARAVRAGYLSGGDSQLQLLLMQQDPSTAQRMLVYFNAFNEDRLQQIRRFRQTLAELEHTRDRIDRAQTTLAESNAALTQQRQQLERSQQERSLLIASLNADMATRRNELEQLLGDRAHLQELIDEINRIIVDIPSPEDAMPFAGARGQLPWPVNGPLLAGFGERYGGSLQRQGIIIGTETGSAVRAVHNGRVVFADWLRGSGNLIVVDHGNSFISLYAQVQAFTKNSGDWVNRGEALALSGSDAGNGSPGLYFEIRQNSRTLNPQDWLTPVSR